MQKIRVSHAHRQRQVHLDYSDRTERVLHSLRKNGGQLARTTPKLEARGEDGRGFSGPGLDHGVFVPFRLMFGEEFTDIPIVQVSMDGTLDAEKNWAVGQAVKELRYRSRAWRSIMHL